MKILLDIDGVMVITPTWQQPDFLADGFMAFDTSCADNLATLIDTIKMQNNTVEIVMTSTHRIHHNPSQWEKRLNNRGIFPDNVSIINDVKIFLEIGKRVDEILAWINQNPSENFIILDDDKSLRNLPKEWQTYWIECQFLTGFNQENLQKAIELIA